MSIIQIENWNGYKGIGERLRIINNGGTAHIKKIYLNNDNQYLQGSNAAAPVTGYIFYHDLYAFKFYDNPTLTSGVVVGDLPIVFTIPGTNITVEDFPSIENYEGYPGPASVSILTAGSPAYLTQYIQGNGISVVNPNQFYGTYINLYNQPLKNYYRAPNSYTLPPYSVAGDYIELFAIFIPNASLRGLYTADLIVEYEDDNGLLYIHTNTLTAKVTETNILEIDRTEEDDIFSIKSFVIGGDHQIIIG
jgi:hypothetical protein|tara:strand:- start:3446 stop:4192 length:747 start_codon:yes stop_codon:yes gene_type:complete